MVGCASDFQSTDSGSSPTYDSSPDTSIQDSIDRTNQQMANDAANAAAQQQFLAGMAAAQETMNNANNNRNLKLVTWCLGLAFKNSVAVDNGAGGVQRQKRENSRGFANRKMSESINGPSKAAYDACDFDAAPL